jgi:hypothetical protein
MSENEKVSVFEERLNSHPVLKDRFESLLDIVEDTAGNYDKADEAELKIIEELRRTGNILMNEWAERKESAGAGELRKSCRDMTGHGKKNSSGIRHSEK